MQRNTVASIKNVSCQSRKTAEQSSLGHESFSAAKLTLYEKTDVMLTEDRRNKNSN
jgi:hypothetical protein